MSTADQDFYGVLYSNPDPLIWDWPSQTGISWVFHDGLQVRTWQEAGQKPRFTDYSSDLEIEQIFGHYESPEGLVYYAVKWAGYACPTWESDINYSCKHVADYHQRLSAPGLALAPILANDRQSSVVKGAMDMSDSDLDRAYTSDLNGRSGPQVTNVVGCCARKPAETAARNDAEGPNFREYVVCDAEDGPCRH
ncbi:hypothetical protein ACKVWC_011403 [Pyricularia oryzae]